MTSVVTQEPLITDSVSLRQITDVLDRLPIDRSGPTVAANLGLIHQLGQPGTMTGLLQEILGDEKALATIAARSYAHTNHFDKIVLVDSGTPLGYRLTLHLWNPPYSDAEAEDEQIHDHRFSFVSHVVVGTLTSQNFVRDPTGVQFGEYQYIPEKLNDVATVGNYYVNVGTSPLLEADRPSVPQGHSYSLDFAQIHRVLLPRTSPTCTLVLRGPRQKNYASVFSNSQKYDPSANAMFAPAELAGKLRIILDHIAASA
ncbi:hypothetical protein [Streptomyces sp. NPDC046727]|uniref:hypothetical protein n=1 Tax=Streptomyces sp. NPDC046727 TaxID=3155373 RepID=UPI0033E8E8C1